MRNDRFDNFNRQRDIPVVLTGVGIGVIGITLIGGGIDFTARYREIQAVSQLWAIDASNEDYFLKIQANINKARHEVGDCSVSDRWDNVNAKDNNHRYNAILRAKVNAHGSGDQTWIDNKLPILCP